MTLREKCPYSDLFWSVFSCIQTEYGKIQNISPHSVRMWENKDQKNSEYGHPSRSLIKKCVNSLRDHTLINKIHYFMEVKIVRGKCHGK